MQPTMSSGAVHAVNDAAHRLEQRKACLAALKAENRAVRQRLEGEPPAHPAAAANTPARGPAAPPARRTSFSAQAAADSATQPIASFSSHAAVSIADLLHMQGRSAQRMLDLSSRSLRELAEACRERIAGAVPVHAVCWFVQSRRAVAPGVGLSVSSTLSTPACAASLLLLWLSVQLECGLLLCERKYINAEVGHLASEAPQYTTQARSPALQERSGPDALPDHAEHNAEAQPEPAGLMHVVAGQEQTQRLLEGAGECASPSGGTNGGSAAGASMCSGAYAALQSGSSGYAFMQSSGSLISVGDGSAGNGGADAGNRLRTGVNGSVPLGDAAQHVVEAVVHRLQRRLPASVILPPLKRLLEVLHAALEPLLPAVEPEHTAPPAAGVSDGSPAPAGMAVGATGAASSAGGEHAAEGSPPHTVAAVPDSARPVVLVSEAMCASLEMSIGKLASQGQQVQAVKASPEAHARHLRDLEALMQDLELAVILTGCDAARRLAQLMLLALARTSGQPFQEERMHLNLYRDMSLAPEQKQTMAALWRSWHDKRRGLDADAAAAVESLTEVAPLTCPPAASLFAARGDGQTPAGAQAVWGDPGASSPLLCLYGMVLQPHHAQHTPNSLWGESSTDQDSGAATMHGASGGDDFMHAENAYGQAHPRLLLQRASNMQPGHPWEAARVPPGMLGQCPAATEAAKAAFDSLRLAHKGVAGQVLDFSVFLTIPGEVLGIEELMRMMWEPVRDGSGPVDKVELCLQAVQQRRREDVFEGVDDFAV